MLKNQHLRTLDQRATLSGNIECSVGLVCCICIYNIELIFGYKRYLWGNGICRYECVCARVRVCVREYECMCIELQIKAFFLIENNFSKFWNTVADLAITVGFFVCVYIIYIHNIHFIFHYILYIYICIYNKIFILFYYRYII